MERSWRMAKRGAALVKESDDRIKEALDREQEMAANRVNDVKEYIWLITTRTQAIELLKDILESKADETHITQFLADLKEHK